MTAGVHFQADDFVGQPRRSQTLANPSVSISRKMMSTQPEQEPLWWLRWSILVNKRVTAEVIGNDIQPEPATTNNNRQPAVTICGYMACPEMVVSRTVMLTPAETTDPDTLGMLRAARKSPRVYPPLWTRYDAYFVVSRTEPFSETTCPSTVSGCHRERWPNQEWVVHY